MALKYSAESGSRANCWPTAAAYAPEASGHSRRDRARADADPPATPRKRRARFPAPLGIDLPEPRAGADLQALAETRMRVRRAQPLYRAGDGFELMYLVRFGFFKSTVVSRDGREQVTGFAMAGDLLGLDGIASGLHACDVTALEDSEVYAIPYAWLIDGSGLDLTRRRLLDRLLSREIVREGQVLVMLGSMCAEERIAGFLLGMAERLRVRGFSASEFVLRMTRSEVGSFLGLKLETVSRQLAHMSHLGMIDVKAKHIRVLDAEALRRVVAGPAPTAARLGRAMGRRAPAEGAPAASLGAFV